MADVGMSVFRRYFAGMLFWTTLLALAVLLALFSFFSLIDQLEDAGKGNYGPVQASFYVLLTMPRLASELFPIAAMIGSMATLGILAHGSELAVIRTAGVSQAELGRLLVEAALPLVLLAIIVGELVAPFAEEKAQHLRSIAMTQQITLKTKYGFWARDGNSYINIRKILPGRRVEQIYIYEFDGDSRLRTSTRAREARYTADGWLLEGIQQTTIDGETITQRSLKRAAWDSLLDPRMLSLVIIEPQYLTVVGLARYIGYLRKNSQDSRVYEQALWVKLVRPFSILAMIVLAVPLVRAHVRSAPVGQRVFQGAAAGVLFHIVNQASGNLGMVYGLAPPLGVVTPTVMLIGVLIWMLRD
ncbi:MAG: LPS export ABC transporter permease LptG [Gammaproteobacteria bacterium]|nr:LPS export ABC transporter permease LptG [Gammaproteobacteria bacterium]